MGPPARPLVFESVTFGPTPNANPPIPASMLRSYYPDGLDTTGKPTGQKGSLYAEMLVPQAKQARTIHNPELPHVVPEPSRPPPAPIARRSSRHSVDEGARRSPRTTASSSRPRAHSHTAHASTTRSPKARDKGKGREVPPGEDDMKAAETLARLMMTGSSALPGSPRSVASDVSMRSVSTVGGAGNAAFTGLARTRTPPVPGPGSIGATTPKRTNSSRSDGSAGGGGIPGAGAPTDTEAADLMLFLATSPSPATRERARRGSESEFGGLRSLSSDSLRAKGRVLFGGAAGVSDTNGQQQQSQARPLNRNATAPEQWSVGLRGPSQPPRAGSFAGSGSLSVNTGAPMTRSPLVSEIVPTPVDEVSPALPAPGTLAPGVLSGTVPGYIQGGPPLPEAYQRASTFWNSRDEHAPVTERNTALGFSPFSFQSASPSSGPVAIGANDDPSLHGRRLPEAV